MALFKLLTKVTFLDALRKLGTSFVGVTQLPVTVADDEVIRLNEAGVRAVRFNLKRGGAEDIFHLSTIAKRVNEIAGWHVELYLDSRELPEFYATLIELPSVSIDHLGLSKAGLKLLTKLVEQGIRVKATGFSRVDFEVKSVLKRLYSANPKSLMFGTDLPSTRAPISYSENDFMLVVEVLGPEGAKDVLSRNAIEFYKPQKVANEKG